jgi:SET domain-containing protein
MFGTGPYHNLDKNIVLKECSDIGRGLFAKDVIPKHTIVWSERDDGPSMNNYRIIYMNEVEHLSESEKEFFIKYGYQVDDELFLSPLNQEEVDLDYSNYFNHSCNPNVLPLDEENWIAIRDINKDEHLTIDYCTFDSNIYNCINEL